MMHYIMEPRIIRYIVILVVMKLCSKSLEQQFGILVPENFLSVNGSSCHLRDVFASTGTPSAQSVATWLYSSKFILPVLGGVLANSRIGHHRILVSCGYVTLISTVLLATSMYRNLICHSIAMVVIIWVPISVVYGIIQPAFYFGLIRWHLSEPAVWTLLASSYYAFLKTGEFIGLLLPGLWSLMGSNFILIYVCMSIVYIVLSSCLPAEVQRVPLLIPTRARLIRFCKAFTFMALFLVSVMRNRSAVYSREIWYFTNATCSTCNFSSRVEPVILASPEVTKVFSQIFWSLLLAYFASRSKTQLPVEPRLYAGICIEALVSVALVPVVSFAPPSSPSSVRVCFSVASALDGMAEILTGSASCELMLSVAHRNSRFLIFGVFFTVWGLASVAGSGLVAALDAVSFGKPAADKVPVFFVYHLVILALMVLSFAHYRFSARSLIVTLSLADVEEELANSEANEKISRTESSELLVAVTPAV